MENKTLTAKKWVDKYNEETDSQYSDYDCNYPMMEQYANYKNKELENKIVEFRFFLESEQTRNTTNSDALVNEEMNYLFNYLLPLYNKHFNIKEIKI